MGMISVLRTWTQTLIYHPHIHCFVPAGGITSEGKWKAKKSDGNGPQRTTANMIMQYRMPFTADFPATE